MIHFLAFCAVGFPAMLLAEHANREQLKWPVTALMVYGHLTIELSWLFADIVEAALQ